ncbi:MAG: DUF2254 domain-containing protein [Rhodoferax sp.]|nr:DUF2254 domain-containing protein [Rhodoferax sp.]
MMPTFLSAERILFVLRRFRERLWVKPLIMCLLSIATVLSARIADSYELEKLVPGISIDSVESLLAVMASSMLVIATFAVGSMVSAYASASNTATPRAFRLVVADDVSQNALSTFIGAFIFSIVALTAVKNDFFAVGGRFSIFVLTLMVLGTVVFTFVRWVDSIARLGRMETAIAKVESATANAMRARKRAPHLHGEPCTALDTDADAIFSDTVGYVQQVDVAALQACAKKAGTRLVLAALPGTFVAPGQALLHVRHTADGDGDVDPAALRKAFVIGHERLFDDDPRFGLIVLSEIGTRALSPGINDPGTAIATIGTLVRLMVLWSEPLAEAAESAEHAHHDRIEVPPLSVDDMFDDAFTAIGRDGAAMVDVSLRLQKALDALARLQEPGMHAAATRHARMALARCEHAMPLARDLAQVREAARFSTPATSA